MRHEASRERGEAQPACFLFAHDTMEGSAPTEMTEVETMQYVQQMQQQLRVFWAKQQQEVRAMRYFYSQ